MTPEVQEYLNKAQKFLLEARTVLAANLTDAAGRASYLASFHAAKAFILTKTGKIAKTHKGVHNQFYELTKDNPRVDIELHRFLSKGYSLKAIADYEVGQSATVPKEYATEAIAAATRFVDCISAILEDGE